MSAPESFTLPEPGPKREEGPRAQRGVIEAVLAKLKEMVAMSKGEKRDPNLDPSIADAGGAWKWKPLVKEMPKENGTAEKPE